MQNLIATATLAIGLGLLTPAMAAEPAGVPAARLLGSSRMSFFGLDIYDARLWTSPGFVAADYVTHTFALELAYLRGLDGRAIASRSIQEMRGIEAMSEAQERDWLPALGRLIPDVRKGDRITGIHMPGTGVRFLLNDLPLGDIADPVFGRIFMGIWLSPRTSAPAMRRSLLGGSAG